MADIKWLKITNTMFEDEKIEYIESLPDGDALINIWVKTLCLASKCNESGGLIFANEIPYTIDLLAIKFKKSVKQIEYAYSLFSRLDMLTYDNDLYAVSNWNKYQNVDKLEEIREKNRQRVSSYRKRQKDKLLEEECNVTGNVTCNAKCNDFALISNSISNSIYSNNNIYIDKEKENIKEKEINIDVDLWFDNIYKVYPRHISKVQAKTTFLHKIDKLDYEEAHKKSQQIYSAILIAKELWDKENDGDGRKLEYIPHLSSWLNDNVEDSKNYKRGKRK